MFIKKDIGVLNATKLSSTLLTLSDGHHFKSWYLS